MRREEAPARVELAPLQATVRNDRVFEDVNDFRLVGKSVFQDVKAAARARVETEELVAHMVPLLLRLRIVVALDEENIVERQERVFERDGAANLNRFDEKGLAFRLLLDRGRVGAFFEVGERRDVGGEFLFVERFEERFDETVDSAQRDVERVAVGFENRRSRVAGVFGDVIARRPGGDLLGQRKKFARRFERLRVGGFVVNFAVGADEERANDREVVRAFRRNFKARVAVNRVVVGVTFGSGFEFEKKRRLAGQVEFANFRRFFPLHKTAAPNELTVGEREELHMALTVRFVGDSDFGNKTNRAGFREANDETARRVRADAAFEGFSGDDQRIAVDRFAVLGGFVTAFDGA